MNKKGILQLIEENPIILGINKESDLKLAAKAESQVVFTLFGTISNIGDTIEAACVCKHRHGGWIFSQKQRR